MPNVLTQRRYADRPQLLHKVPNDGDEERTEHGAFLATGMMRKPAQLSWHFMKLLHDSERGTLVVVHRGLHDLTGPFLITPTPEEPVTGWFGRRQRYVMGNPSAKYYGGLMSIHMERIRRTAVLEVRSLGERRFMTVRESRIDRIMAIVADLNAALGYAPQSDAGAGDDPTRAAIAAALDAIPVAADQIPSPRKAALITRRRRRAFRAIAFHRRNRLRSTAHPSVALALAVVNLAITTGIMFGCGSFLDLQRGWLIQGVGGGFIVFMWAGFAAAIGYALRAFITTPAERAAAAAELRALKRG